MRSLGVILRAGSWDRVLLMGVVSGFICLPVPLGSGWGRGPHPQQLLPPRVSSLVMA